MADSSSYADVLNINRQAGGAGKRTIDCQEWEISQAGGGNIQGIVCADILVMLPSERHKQAN